MDKTITIGTQKYVCRDGVKIPVVATGEKKAISRSGSISGVGNSGNVRALGGISKPRGWNAPLANRVVHAKIEPPKEKTVGKDIPKEEIPVKNDRNIPVIECELGKSAGNQAVDEPISGNSQEKGSDEGAETGEEAKKEMPRRGRGRRGRKRKQAADEVMMI